MKAQFQTKADADADADAGEGAAASAGTPQMYLDSDPVQSSLSRLGQNQVVNRQHRLGQEVQCKWDK